jgi:predicted CoA-substrate-specific enzyme activase
MHDHKGPQLIQIAPLEPQAPRIQQTKPAQKPHDHSTEFMVGLDVGSTTVKAVVVHAATDQVLWQDYQRHETKQPEKTLEFLKRMEADAGINRQNTRMFLTGSGGGGIAEQIGAKFVQEVTAVSLAVEKLHPEVYSVIELGGQDAKIIVFKDDAESGRKKKIPSMNDKCAGGTGAVIDKINAKLKIPTQQLGEQKYQGVKLHKVAGKCGVFAETDINSLQKVGTPPDELMASLFEAIVLQNLSVLTRGHTLRPHVLLLGGPNSFIRGMREAWQANIPRMWQERKVQVPDGAKPEDLIKVPQNAQYFAALGAIEFGRAEDDSIGCYLGYDQLIHYIDYGRQEEKAKSGGKGLVENPAEFDGFKEAYRRKTFTPAAFQKGSTVGGFIGIDGGSTSTKAVLLNENGDILCKSYQLSNGNPIQDTIEMFESLRGQVEAQGAKMEVLGVATTGYAKDILKDVLKADVALVETVAHTESALKFYEDPHVIVDVGGQDIKIIILHNGRVKDFKLNTQCSAGNGYFLQSTAEGFGLNVNQYADLAFSANAMPVFGYGCAVFMQSDIVNFQRQGWRAEEILAGLAAVLPKNVFLYVASIPNLAALGTRFVLQGGTQNNLAVVKAEVDFIRNSFRAAGKQPEIIVHEHCGESGAIGAAQESLRLWRNGQQTTFVGLDAVRKIEYRTTRNESTRCNFCKNNCLRTFIDIRTEPAKDFVPIKKVTKVPLMLGEQRLIIATCEKGLVEDVNEMKDIKAGLEKIRDQYPNFVDFAAKEVFRPTNAKNVADSVPTRAWTKPAKERIALMQNRNKLRIGIPRVLNIYTYAPLFNAYFESLGVQPENIIYSDYTSSELYRAGASRGAIDPCFPAKIGISHVYNLIQEKHRKKPLNAIFFPMYDVLHTPLVKLQGANACPTVTATPETVKAAFTKENDVFADNNVKYLNPVLNFADRKLFAYQMLQALQPVLGLSEEENDRAVESGFQALKDYETNIRRRARQVLDQLEREDRIGIVMLGRPYHHDPGLNHEILDEFQKLGYPIFSQNTLPLDEDMLERLFGEEVRSGVISSPLDIGDAWKNSYSCSTNHKVWAAKFTARHPNLVALEISSFKCGHDAPIYGVIEGIIEQSGTPYFCFKDLDENKPTGSIRIRVETIDYFLRRYREEVIRKRKAEQDIEAQLAALEAQLRRERDMGAEPAMPLNQTAMEREIQEMAAD